MRRGQSPIREGDLCTERRRVFLSSPAKPLLFRSWTCVMDDPHLLYFCWRSAVRANRGQGFIGQVDSILITGESSPADPTNATKLMKIIAVATFAGCSATFELNEFLKMAHYDQEHLKNLVVYQEKSTQGLSSLEAFPLREVLVTAVLTARVWICILLFKFEVAK